MKQTIRQGKRGRDLTPAIGMSLFGALALALLIIGHSASAKGERFFDHAPATSKAGAPETDAKEPQNTYQSPFSG
ncbi:MAG: hypothetical protein AAFO73_06420 [Pseudomonadota bacterium]